MNQLSCLFNCYLKSDAETIAAKIRFKGLTEAENIQVSRSDTIDWAGKRPWQVFVYDPGPCGDQLRQDWRDFGAACKQTALCYSFAF